LKSSGKALQKLLTKVKQKKKRGKIKDAQNNYRSVPYHLQYKFASAAVGSDSRDVAPCGVLRVWWGEIGFSEEASLDLRENSP
jgi:hypothetical protein